MPEVHRAGIERPVLLLVALATPCLFTGSARAAETKRPELLLPLGHPSGSYVYCVAMSADGKLVLTGSDDNTAILWDADTGKPIRTFKGHTETVSSVALSADGKRVFTWAYEKGILWDASTGKRLLTLKALPLGERLLLAAAGKPVPEHLNSVHSVALSGNGSRVLTGSEYRAAVVWDAGSGRRIQTFKGHTRPVTSVALRIDGKRVLTASGDGTARLWDVDSGKTLRTFSGRTDRIVPSTG
jgi:WD40 repeat protein